MAPKPAPVPSAQAIRDMDPEEAVAIYQGLTQKQAARLNSNQRKAFVHQQTQLGKPKASSQLPFIGEGMGAVKINEKGKATGLTTGTPSYKGLDSDQAKIYGDRKQQQTAGGLAALYSNQPYQEPTHPPRYLEGEQFKPVDMDVDQIIDLQTKLVKGGLLKEGSFIYGTWRAESAAAYTQALKDANVADKDVNDIIDQYVMNPKKKVRPPLIHHLTNPDDIMASTRTAAKNLFGRNIELPKAVQDQLVAGLQQTERDSQQQAYDLGGEVDENGMLSGPGGSVTDPAAAENYAEQRIQEMYPGRTTDDEFAGAMDRMLNLIRGSGQ